MRKIISVWCLMTAALTALSCGQIGQEPADQSQPNLPPPSMPDTSVGNGSTGVRLAMTVPQSPAVKNCIAAQTLASPYAVVPGFHLDGQISDWADVQPIGNDPQGDSLTGDLRTVHLGVDESTGKRVVGYLSVANLDPQGSVYLDFQVLDGQDESRTHQKYRIHGGELQQLDQWTQSYLPQTSSRGLAAVEGDVIEFAIPMHYLDGALLRQTWSLRVSSENPDLSGDMMGLMEFVGDVPESARPSLSGCLVSQLTDTPMIFHQIVHPEIDEEVAGKLLGIARNAFESVYVAFNRPVLQLNQLPVTVTDGSEIQPHGPEFFRNYSLRSSSGLRLPANLYADESIEYERDKVVLAHAIDSYVGLMVDSAYSQGPIHLREIIKTIMSSHLIRRRLGEGFWLVRAQSQEEKFREASRLGHVQSLSEHYRNFLEQEPSQEESELFISMMKSYGHRLSLHLNERVFLQLLDLLSDEPHYSLGDSESRFFELVMQKLPESSEELLQTCKSGWLLAGDYDETCSPRHLDDLDGDGLVDYVEEKLGSHRAHKDSDDDGWSDYGEYLVGKNPMSAASRPEMIVADGFFGDWQALLPNKVSTDAGITSTKCPAVADIVHYAGLLDRERLVVAARALDVWTSSPKVHWEVLVEVYAQQGRRQYTLRSVGGSRDFDIFDTNTGALIKKVKGVVPMAHDTIEWVMDFGVEGLGLADISKESVRYRIQLIFERTERMICDDTAWTAPLMERQ